MKAIRWLVVVALGGVLGADAAAQTKLSDVAKVKVELIPAKARPGESVLWRLTIDVSPGWHTYPTKQINEEASSYRTNIVWPKKGELIFVGDIVEKPAPNTVIENGVPTLEIEGTAVFERTAVVSPKARPGTLKADMRTILLV